MNVSLSDPAFWSRFQFGFTLTHDTRNTKETYMNHEITLEVAEKMIRAAKSKAEELKILEDIAVVETSRICL